MLVVEDIKTREIYRFLVVDGCMQIGVVTLNSHEKTFDAERALGYVSRVKGQLLSLVSSYKHSYRYVLRRAYDHLKKPPFLASLSGGPAGAQETEWLVDQFAVKPLLSIGGLNLTQRNQERSSKLVVSATKASQNEGRFFRIQDTGGTDATRGFFIAVHAKRILKMMEGKDRNDILRFVKRGRPILIQLAEPEELDDVLKWLIHMRDSNLRDPVLILHALDHKKWTDRIERLVDIPHARILTAGSTIVSLSSLIGALRRKLGNGWSERLVFGSNYPETNLGDGIPELLSYLLSKNLDASPQDIQRILAGNLLALLPIRPPYLKYQDRDGGVVAEGRLGKPAMQELIRVVQILTSSREYTLESFSYAHDRETGTIDTSTFVLTLLDEQSKRGTTVVVRQNPDSSLEVCSWSPQFDITDVAQDPSNLKALVRSCSTTSALIFDSPVHLNSYVKGLTKCFNVRRPEELLAALRYRLETAEIPRGHLRLADASIGALGKSADDAILAMSQRKGQWWVARSIPSYEARPRTVMISEDDLRYLGLEIGEEIDLTGYQEGVVEAERILLTTKPQEDVDPGETYSYLHLHSRQIKEAVRPLLLGQGSKVYPFAKRDSLPLEVVRTDPLVQTGEIATLTEAEIMVRQPEFLEDVDVIICIALGKQMVLRDLEIGTPYSVGARLKETLQDLENYPDFLDDLGADSSRLQVAVISALLILESLEENRSEGRLGLCIAGERLKRFSIQHGAEIQDFVDFDRDLESPEVRAALRMFLLDALQENKSSKATAHAYRAINEYVDDFGMARPALAVLIGDFADEVDETARPFVHALPTHQCFELLRLQTRALAESKNGEDGNVVTMDSLTIQGLMGEFARALRRVERGQSSSR
jgi:hypothetical protein